MTSKQVDQYSVATIAAADQLIGIDASDTTDSANGTVKRFVATDFARTAAANTFTLGPNLFKAGADGYVALQARRNSSGATANIEEWQDESGTPLGWIDKHGTAWPNRIGMGAAAAPIDSGYYDSFIDIYDTAFTPTNAGNDYYGVSSYVSLGAHAFGQFMYGQLFGLDTGVATSIGTAGNGHLIGISGTVNHFANIAVTDVTGATFTSGVYAGAGNITSWMRGVRAFVYHQLESGTANVGGAAAINVGTPVGSGWTAIPLYGIYIETHAGHGTNEYAILSEGGEVRLKTGIATGVGLSVQRYTAQSAHLFNALDTDGTTVLSYMDSAGKWSSSAIPDLSGTYQPLDSDLTAIAALTTTSYGRSVLTTADAAALRTLAGAVIGTNVQAWDADLDALAALASTGILSRTASNTYAQRTLTGTSARITVTNGDGVSGNPTIDLSTSYVGQATITTLGTIATGTWSGTTIGLAKGGTNADLSATGGSNQVLKQTSVGGAISVATLLAADIPNIAESQVTNLTSDLALKAPLADPTFTGVPAAPTATAGTNTTQLATTAFVTTAVAGGGSGSTGLTSAFAMGFVGN
jgi:hypothetical protein